MNFSLRPGITSKLFLTILLSCALVAVAVTAGMRYSFNQGFLGYLNQQELQRIEVLAPNLAQAYQEEGNWDFLRDNPRAWFGLLRGQAHRALPDAKNGQALSRRHERTGNRPPPPALPESDLTGLQLRISLLDREKQRVVGNLHSRSDAIIRPVMVDGVTVGWLALVPFQQVSTGAALRFQEQQRKTSWIAAGLALMLAALLAWLLARMILAPLKRVAASTHRLAQGDYQARVAVNSSDELGQLSENFNQLARTLERNEQLRRDFMADVSHELRTPLAVLKGEIEAMEDGVRPLSVAGMHSLQTEVNTLGKLIDDLYELSLSDAGALSYRFQRINLPALLEEVQHMYAERFADAGLDLSTTLATQPPVFVQADPDRLRQLFSNLLENTLRYTQAPGALRIHGSQAGGRLVLDFEDSAPGVETAVLSRLFERFYRVEHSRSRTTGGAGLGLAICRNIVEAHQGVIRASASPLGGISIQLELPVTA